MQELTRYVLVARRAVAAFYSGKKPEAESWEQWGALLTRVKGLAALAETGGVRLLIDAEQTYFQAAIDHVANATQAACNTRTPVVYNTIQCYLRRAPGFLNQQLELARMYGSSLSLLFLPAFLFLICPIDSSGFRYGVKLVRGAYLTQVSVFLGPHLSYFGMCLGRLFIGTATSVGDGLRRSHVVVQSRNPHFLRYQRGHRH